jgi:hypothetical protein
MMIEFFKKLRFYNHGTPTDGHLHVVYFGDHLRNDVQISKTYLYVYYYNRNMLTTTDF